jgi:hypothetical protein
MQAVSRTHHQPLDWCGDGWRGYPKSLSRHSRRLQKTGKRGRPSFSMPPTVRLTQTIKHRDHQGRLLAVEIKAVFGTEIPQARTVHIERFNGGLRDRLNALTRKTHAFAKTDATWDALVSLQIFEHNFARPHSALRLPCPDTPGRFIRRTPAMVRGLTEHIWSFEKLLTTSL